MFKAVFLVAGFALLTGIGHAQSAAVELANLREDVRLLNQRMGELHMKVEQLERENSALRANAGNTAGLATVSQLNEAVIELRQAIAAGDTATAERAAAQIKKLGDATNVALDALSSRPAARAASSTPAASSSSAATPASFSTDFPSEGISYTVQKGDTLSRIASKTGGKVADIINANKLSDPSKVRVGDTLFIPVAAPAK